MSEWMQEGQEIQKSMESLVGTFRITLSTWHAVKEELRRRIDLGGDSADWWKAE